MKWSGLYTALITPFKENQLDEEGLRQLIHFQKESGVTGLIFLGSTGEVSSLTEREKERILSIAKEEAQGLQLIVGTGTCSTEQTIERTQRAADKGADAVLVISPYYVKPTQEGLYRHFEAVAQASPLPIILYNNPARSIVSIEATTFKKLLQFPQIQSMKDASSDLMRLSDIFIEIKSERPDFSILCGDDAFIFPFMNLGAKGAITMIGNILPREAKMLIDSCLNQQCDAAEYYYRLFPLLKALTVETNPIPLKYAMKIADMPAGEPRLPLTPLSSKYALEVEECLKLFLECV